MAEVEFTAEGPIEEIFEGIVYGVLGDLYGPEHALLMRRAYAASILTLLGPRAPFGVRSSVQPLAFGQPFKIGENMTRDRAMALFINTNGTPGLAYIYSSGPGPAGGGGSYVGSTGEPQTLFGAGQNFRRFVLLPSEELWATQVSGPLTQLNIATEYY